MDKRLLCIVGGMNRGGAETFLMKIFRVIKEYGYKMDFAVAIEYEGDYDAEIRRMGGVIYHITPKSKGIVKNFKDIIKLVHNNKYKYVLRTSQHSLSAIELFAAKLGGASYRVFRSSNSNTTTGGIDVILHRIFLFLPRWFSNIRIAPSKIAAEFMFGKNCIEKGSAKLIHNGLDLDQFKFNLEHREAIRARLKIEDKLVVGHVGRFNQQKNHLFLIETFNEMVKIDNNAVLLLVGKGELETAIKNRVVELRLEDKVLFLGVRDDIPQLMAAIDLIVFPSLYEGMPNTIIEAQALGVPCIISDTITEEVKLTELVREKSLSESSDEWAREGIKLYNQFCGKRERYCDELISMGYGIEQCSKDFIQTVFNREV